MSWIWCHSIWFWFTHTALQPKIFQKNFIKCLVGSHVGPLFASNLSIFLKLIVPGQILALMLVVPFKKKKKKKKGTTSPLRLAYAHTNHFNYLNSHFRVKRFPVWASFENPHPDLIRVNSPHRWLASHLSSVPCPSCDCISGAWYQPCSPIHINTPLEALV